MFLGLLFFFIFFCSLEQSVQLVLSWVGCGFKGLEAGGWTRYRHKLKLLQNPVAPSPPPPHLLHKDFFIFLASIKGIVHLKILFCFKSHIFGRNSDVWWWTIPWVVLSLWRVSPLRFTLPFVHYKFSSSIWWSPIKVFFQIKWREEQVDPAWCFTVYSRPVVKVWFVYI